MKISSHKLLVMVLGGLNFSADILSRFSGKIVDEKFFKELEEMQIAVNNDLIYKFAEYYIQELRLLDGKFEPMTIYFPTPENKGEWQMLFEMQQNEYFVCKKGKMPELWNEFRRIEHTIKFMPMSVALRRVVINKLAEAICKEMCNREMYDL